MPNRSLLKIRLDELQQDVEKVRTVVDLTKRRHELVQMLHHYIHPLGEQSVNPPLVHARTTLDRLPDVLKQFNPDLLAFIKKHGITLSAAKAAAAKALTGLRAAQQALDDFGAPVELDVATKGELNNNLETCQSIISEIGDLRGKLETDGDVQSLWRDFDKLREERCEVLFADYVDFLGGLTLRDNRFDNRVCDLTDTFLQQAGEMQRLTVPARSPARPSVLNVLMKLGFPEWTLWDVPMAAYEVAVKQEAKSEAAQRLLHRQLSGRTAVQEIVLFADAHASYVAGPAYACSAILLHLRPDQPASDLSPADTDRAHAIFELLSRVGAADSKFAVDVCQIRRSWESASDELVGSAQPDNPDALNRFVDEIYRTLTADPTIPCFDPARWEKATNLLRSVFEPGTGPTTYSGPVLDLLNAAWSARLRKPESSNDIEKLALNAWFPSGQPGDRRRPGTQDGRTPPGGEVHGKPRSEAGGADEADLRDIPATRRRHWPAPY